MTEIKNNANPLVSIIVPVFNVEKYIKESLESILSQTYSNLEVIIIDDCSTDSTYEICSKYADKNEKIKLYQTKSNKGTPSSPKNLGLKKATGEFILFVDGDDFIDISMIDNKELKRIINYAFRMVYYIRGNNRNLNFDIDGYFKDSDIIHNEYFQECFRSL